MLKTKIAQWLFKLSISLEPQIVPTEKQETRKTKKTNKQAKKAKAAKNDKLPALSIEPIPCNLDWWQMMGIPRPLNNLIAISNKRLVDAWLLYHPIPVYTLNSRAFSYCYRPHRIPRFSQNSQVILRMLSESQNESF